jgi:hypothetical protein
VRFRAECFQVGHEVRIYAGDTPRSLAPGWVDGQVVAAQRRLLLGEFFRIFADNAQRSWAPLWCIDRAFQTSQVRDSFR